MSENVFTVEQIKQLILQNTGIMPAFIDNMPTEHFQGIQTRINAYADRGNDYGTSFSKAWYDYINTLKGEYNAT